MRDEERREVADEIIKHIKKYFSQEATLYEIKSNTKRIIVSFKVE